MHGISHAVVAVVDCTNGDFQIEQTLLQCEHKSPWLRCLGKSGVDRT